MAWRISNGVMASISWLMALMSGNNGVISVIASVKMYVENGMSAAGGESGAQHQKYQRNNEMAWLCAVNVTMRKRNVKYQ
jgi:hypothetical protein